MELQAVSSEEMLDALRRALAGEVTGALPLVAVSDNITLLAFDSMAILTGENPPRSACVAQALAMAVALHVAITLDEKDHDSTIDQLADHIKDLAGVFYDHIASQGMVEGVTIQ